MDNKQKVIYLETILRSFEKSLEEITQNKTLLLKDLKVLQDEGLIKNKINAKINKDLTVKEIKNEKDIELTDSGIEFLEKNIDLIREP